MQKKNIETIRQNFTNEDISRINKAVGRQLSDLELLLCTQFWPYNTRTIQKWLKKLLQKGENVVFEPTYNKPGVIEFTDNQCCLVNIKCYSTDELQTWLKNMQETCLQIQIQTVENTGVFGLLNIGNSILTIEHDIKKFISTADRFAKHFAINDLSLLLNQNPGFFELPQICHLAYGTVKKTMLIDENIDYENCKVFLLHIDSPEIKEGKNKNGNKNAETGIEPDLLGFFDSKQLVETIKELHKETLIHHVSQISQNGIIGSAISILNEIPYGISLNIQKNNTATDDFLYEYICSNNTGILIFLSEKQNERKIQNIIQNTSFTISCIGEICKENSLKIIHNNTLKVNFPAKIIKNENQIELSDQTYERPEEKIKNSGKFSISKIAIPNNLKELAWEISIAIRNQYKKWNYLQQTDRATSVLLDVPNTNKQIVLNCLSNERYMRTNPQAGAAIVFADAVKNVVCAGASPFAFAATFALGNQENPALLWQFIESVKGINKMCRLYNLPVISTDFCFVPEESSSKFAITLAVLGLRKKDTETSYSAFKQKSDMIFLIGESKNDLSASFYVNYKYDYTETPAPYFELSKAFQLKNLIKLLIQKELVNSVQNVAEGGIFHTLVKSGCPNSLGFDITTDAEIRTDVFLFSEAKNRIIVSVSAQNETDFIDFMVEKNYPFTTLGHVTKGEMRVDDVSFGKIEDLKQYFNKEQNVT